MNSVLQPILATPYLNEYFLNTFSTEKKLRTTRVAEAYHELLRECSSSRSSVTPSSIKNAVSRTGGGAASFSGYGQQDSQEFMRFLLDRMHDELNRVQKKPPYKELNFGKMSIDK